MALHVEGSATIHRLKEVFLNPPQVFNRDMTMLVADTFARRLKAGAKKPIEGVSVLEPLAGTGIRSIRYFKELTVPVIKLLTNDLSADAVNEIKRNFALNEVIGEVTQRDACDLLYSQRHDQWDIIDLDPYGTVAPFIDAALQSVKSGGLLCLTSTDMATLCGAHTETCFYKYGCVPTHDAHCHEFALRMILHSLNTAATRYQRVVVPLLSLSVDFYSACSSKSVSLRSKLKTPS
jgi:tRNA (guanine26-N2/guanine27-N2)-dimethyltransferase